MKNYLTCSKKLLISFVAVSCLLFQISNANAFGLEDLSSSADSIKTASDTMHIGALTTITELRAFTTDSQVQQSN